MIRVRVLSVALLSLLVALAGTAWSETETGPEADYDRWVPGFSMAINLFSYKADGEILSAVRYSSHGSSSNTASTFRFGLDVQSPAIRIRSMPVHLIGFGGGQAGPSQPLTTARYLGFQEGQPEGDIRQLQGVPGSLTNPPCNVPNFQMLVIPCPPPAAIRGQGSQLDSTYDGYGWYAGIGTAFGLPGLESLIRVKPYLRYVGEHVSAESGVVSVGSTDYLTAPGGNYYVVRSLVKGEEDFHYVGPGIDLELILASTNAVQVSFVGTLDFLFNVGDGQLVMTDPGIQVATYTADNFSFRGGFGLRFAWRSAFGQ